MPIIPLLLAIAWAQISPCPFRGRKRTAFLLDALHGARIISDSGETRPPLHLSHAVRAPAPYARRDGASPLTPTKKASKACLFSHGANDFYPPKSDPANADAKTSIAIRIQGIQGRKGKLLINLFRDRKGFPMDPAKAWATAEKQISGPMEEVFFQRVPAGVYAVSVLHDENGNHILDTNLLGIPKEGVGVSNNAKGKFGPPSFESAAFSVDHKNKNVTIKLEY